jgi:hypothetical protein
MREDSKACDSMRKSASHPKPYQQWLQKDIATISADIVHKIGHHDNIKAVLGFDCINDFGQKVKQMVRRAKSSNERISKSIEETDASLHSIRKKIKDARSDEEREKKIIIKNALTTQMDYLFGIKKLNYFFIAIYTEVIEQISL